jgi:chemotaxis receptor (MCP) glutamine deamidase CheD
MEDKELEMDESGRVNYPNVISSGGLGPCIAVGIYDKKSRSGYMMHKAGADNDKDLEVFLRDTLKSTTKEDLKVWVCGGVIDVDDGDEADVQSARNHVINLIEEYFEKEQVSINWAKPRTITELILNTETGKFTIEKRPY